MRNFMKYSNLLLVPAVLTILLSANALAGGIKVIANPNMKIDTISAGEIRIVFLCERSSLGDGSHVEPVLKRRGSVHEAFLKQYLGQSDDELLRHYQSLVFTGRGSMPKTVGSDEEVVAYVARTRAAIGYVSAETTTAGVKTLVVMDTLKGTERRLVVNVPPVYPEALRQRSIGGIVRLKITVSAKGDVEDINLLGGSPVLAEAATAAVEKWKYAPASSRTVMEVSVPFDPH
jgi:TonB family protein